MLKKIHPSLKKGQTFYLLMATLFSIMLICCILISATFILNEKKSLDKTRQLYNQMANQAINSLTHNLEQFQNYTIQLQDYALDDLNRLSILTHQEMKNSPHLDSFMDFFRKTYLGFQKIPGTIPYVYFEESNYAINLISTEDCLENGEITQILGITMDDWQILTHSSTVPVTFIQQTETMDFARLMISIKIHPSVFLIFAVSSSSILSQMEQHYLPEHSALFMLTSNGQYIIHGEDTIDTDFNFSNYDALETEQNDLRIKYKNKSCFLYSKSIEDSDIRLAAVIQDDLFPKFYKNILYSVFLALFIWLILGGYLSWVVAEKIYQPVSVLLNYLPTINEQVRDFA